MAQTLLEDLSIYAASHDGIIGRVILADLREILQKHSQSVIVELTRKEAGMSLEILKETLKGHRSGTSPAGLQIVETPFVLMNDNRKSSLESVVAKLEGALRESEVQL